jgi:hypothetical protein
LPAILREEHDYAREAISHLPVRAPTLRNPDRAGSDIGRGAAAVNAAMTSGDTSSAAHSEGRGRPIGGALLPKTISCLLLAYWTVMALCLPVVVWDAQTYNLARLRIAEWGGLFGNHGWNSSRQIMFPWGFDAVHLPFLWLKTGTAIPSFSCFVGVLIVVFRLVREKWDASRAWWCVLGLLALPTLVYQATTAKNEMAVEFGVACWVYALWLQEREGGALPVWFGAAGLAFTVGAKTSGLSYAVLCAVWQFWKLRGQRRMQAHFVAALAACLLLFGSGETYVLNRQSFGHLPGPLDAVDDHRNRDGISGATANFIRYFLGNQSIGIDAADPDTPVAGWLARVSTSLLREMGLTDLGLRAHYGETEQNIKFLKQGTDASSDFGLLGAMSLWFGGWILIVRKRVDPLWRLAAAGWAALLLTAATIAWMPWNARFLLLPFSLLTIASVLWWLERFGGSAAARVVLLVVMLIGAVYAPCTSTFRKPSDIVDALYRRSEMECRSRFGMLDVIFSLGNRFPSNRDGSPQPLLFYAAGGDSWILPVWETKGAEIRPVVTDDLADVAAAARAQPKRPIYLLCLNRELPSAVAAKFDELEQFSEDDSVLYRWRKTDGNGTQESPIRLAKIRFVAGFHELEMPIGARFRWTRQISILVAEAPIAARYQFTMRVITPGAAQGGVIRISSADGQSTSFPVRGGSLARPNIHSFDMNLAAGDNPLVLEADFDEAELGRPDSRRAAFGLILPVEIRPIP